MPAVVTPSSTKGEVVLKFPMMTQFWSTKSAPKRMRHISTESAARSAAVIEPRKARSE